MKIATIVGARPQFIKATVVSEKIKNNDLLSEIIIHTGQHFEKNMSDIFFNEMGLPIPNYNLGINQMEYEPMIDKIINKITPILISEKPDGVLVYGDTNSTLAGSLAASKNKIPIFHVEAGLRSYNKSMLEEKNRVKTDNLSKLLFCPTQNALDNLSKEGITDGAVVTGDVMYDVFLKFAELVNNNYERKIVNSNYILATIHRRENTDSKQKLISIFSGLDKINSQLNVIMPLHPQTSKKINDYGIKTKINILPPMGYLSMLALVNKSEMIITDSGGLQKEAFFAKKKCITVRDQTEWTELTEAGVNILCNQDSLGEAYNKMKKRKCDFSGNYYGNGNASESIIKSISDFF